MFLASAQWESSHTQILGLQNERKSKNWRSLGRPWSFGVRRVFIKMPVYRGPGELRGVLSTKASAKGPVGDGETYQVPTP